MENELVKQWPALIKTSMDSFKEMTEANMATANNLRQGLWDNKNSAQVGKALMSASKEWEESNASLLNSLLQNQLNMVDLKAIATAVRELGEFSGEAANRLMQRQTTMMNMFMESNVNYLENMKRAKNIGDLMAAQAHFFSEVQEKTKEHSLETMQVLNSINSAMSAWTEKTIDKAAAEEPAPKAVSTPQRKAS